MESRKHFFKDSVTYWFEINKMKDHLSVLYGIEKRTIQLARYYGDKLLSEPDGNNYRMSGRWTYTWER